MTRLSILIPTVNGREAMFDSLVSRIEHLGNGYPYEIVALKDRKGENSIGFKRNKLRTMAKGDYIAFVDDDDMILDTYFSNTFRAIENNMDVMGIIGVMYTNNMRPKTFEHSTIHDSYYQKNGIYYRPPNHLNPMRKQLSMMVRFPDKSMGEDTDFAMALCHAGVLRTEEFVTDVVYRYNYVENKNY